MGKMTNIVVSRLIENLIVNRIEIGDQIKVPIGLRSYNAIAIDYFYQESKDYLIFVFTESVGICNAIDIDMFLGCLYNNTDNFIKRNMFPGSKYSLFTLSEVFNVDNDMTLIKTNDFRLEYFKNRKALFLDDGSECWWLDNSLKPQYHAAVSAKLEKPLSSYEFINYPMRPRFILKSCPK